MSDHDPKTNVYVTSGPVASSGGGGLYFIVGALIAAALVGVYFLVGAPGLHSDIATAPAERNVNVTVEQPRASPAPSAPAAPATPAPAAPRQ